MTVRCFHSYKLKHIKSENNIYSFYSKVKSMFEKLLPVFHYSVEVCHILYFFPLKISYNHHHLDKSTAVCPRKNGYGESAAISKNVSAIFTILFLIDMSITLGSLCKKMLWIIQTVLKMWLWTWTQIKLRIYIELHWICRWFRESPRDEWLWGIMS